MANLYDYLAWRGDVPFSVAPFNEIDAMIAARLAYLPFEGVMGQKAFVPVPFEQVASTLLIKHEAGALKLTKNQLNLLSAMQGAERFRPLEFLYYVNVFDEESETQFAAVACRVAPELYYLAFRGTDNTLVGWKEDLNMSFVSPVPAQKQAVKYLENAVRIALQLADGEKEVRFIVGGHSKGGNLAVYSAAFASESVQDLIERVYNFDGPGFDGSVISAPGYRRISPKLSTLVPQSSVVGMLLEHEEKYTIVKSRGQNLRQHDTASWELDRSGFIQVESVTTASRFVDYTLKGWMTELPPDRREKFCDAVYQILKDTDANTLRDIGRNKYSSLRKIILSIRSLDEQTRQDINYCLRLLLKSAKLGMVRMVQEKQANFACGKLNRALPG